LKIDPQAIGKVGVLGENHVALSMVFKVLILPRLDCSSCRVIIKWKQAKMGQM
jgi:hypothetical protein